jgi:hypothetical protein
VLTINWVGAEGVIVIVCDGVDCVVGLVGGFCGIIEDRGHVNALVDGKIVVWILIILHDFHPVINLDLIEHCCHSWSVVREVVEGDNAGRRINAFIFAGLNNLKDVVLVRLLQLQVNTQEFSGNAGAGIGVGFNKAFIVIEIVIFPIV